MTMTAVDIDGVSFAVGSAELADPAQAQQALQTMKAGLLNNIHGQLKSEKANSAAPPSLDIEAIGAAPSGGGTLLLMAHFAAKNRRIYQVIVLGPERNVSREAADTFLSSFKAD
jgi:hypothetical protein